MSTKTSCDFYGVKLVWGRQDKVYPEAKIYYGGDGLTVLARKDGSAVILHAWQRYKRLFRYGQIENQPKLMEALLALGLVKKDVAESYLAHVATVQNSSNLAGEAQRARYYMARAGLVMTTEQEARTEHLAVEAKRLRHKKWERPNPSSEEL